jgi:hypothetical protein
MGMEKQYQQDRIVGPALSAWYATMAQSVHYKPEMAMMIADAFKTMAKNPDQVYKKVGPKHKIPEIIRESIPTVELQEAFDKKLKHYSAGDLQSRRGLFGAIKRHHPEFVQEVIKSYIDRDGVRRLAIDERALKEKWQDHPCAKKVYSIMGLEINQKTFNSLHPFWTAPIKVEPIPVKMTEKSIILEGRDRIIANLMVHNEWLGPLGAMVGMSATVEAIANIELSIRNANEKISVGLLGLAEFINPFSKRKRKKSLQATY